MQTRLRQKINQSLIFWAVAIPSILVDQQSKTWVLEHVVVQPRISGLRLEEPYAVEVIPRCLAFIHTQNEGAAFSLFNSRPALLTGVASLLSIAVLVWALFFLPPRERLGRIALGLIFGGAVGNLIDRAVHDFQVTDFILVLFNWKGWYWPTFNVADVSICCGIGLFLLASFLDARRTAAAA